jgi:hypothetical protein
MFDNWNVEGRMGDKLYLLTADTGASVLITRLHITAGFPKRNLTTQCPAVGKGYPSHPERSLVKLNLGCCSLMILEFIPYITHDFILGLDVWSTHNASVDVWHHVLLLGNDELLLLHPRPEYEVIVTW